MAKKETVKVIADNGTLGFVAFVAYVGAVVYFLQGAKHAGDFIYAFIEAIFWPGILVFHMLQNFAA